MPSSRILVWSKRVIADGVVEIPAERTEGINHGLVVILAVIHTFFANALVEDAQVEAVLLIGEPFHLGIGWRLRNPQARRGLFRIRELFAQMRWYWRSTAPS